MLENTANTEIDTANWPGIKSEQYQKKVEAAKKYASTKFNVKLGFKFIEPAKGILDFSGIKLHFQHLRFRLPIEEMKKASVSKSASVAAKNYYKDFISCLPGKYLERFDDREINWGAANILSAIFLICSIIFIFFEVVSPNFKAVDFLSGQQMFVWLWLISMYVVFRYSKKKLKSITTYGAIAFCRDLGRIQLISEDKGVQFDRPYSEFVAMARWTTSPDGYKFYQFSLNHMYTNIGHTIDVKTYEDCQMLLALFNQYMDKTQPMPATPLFESIRDLDPVTKAAYDSGERQVIFENMSNDELKEHQEKVRETCLSYLRQRNEYYGTTFSDLPKPVLN